MTAISDSRFCFVRSAKFEMLSQVQLSEGGGSAPTLPASPVHALHPGPQTPCNRLEITPISHE